MAYFSKRRTKLEKQETFLPERPEVAATRPGRRDILRMGLLTGAGLLIPKIGLGMTSTTRESLLGRTPRASSTAPFFQSASSVQVVSRQRLGNNTEDITYLTQGRKPGLAIMDGYDVLDPSFSPPAKLFDVLGQDIKAAPRGIVYVESRGLYVFSDTLQTATLFRADSAGEPLKPLNIQYPTDATPQSVEGLDYIPTRSLLFPDHLILVASFVNDDGDLEARLEIINFNGQVVQEIVPQGDLAFVFLTGVSFKMPGSLLVSSDDDETIYELDFQGNVLASFTGAPPTQPTLHGIEGLALTLDGRGAAAGGNDGIIAGFAPGNDLPPTLAFDYRIGPGLSLPTGLAWDSSNNQFLLISFDRARDLNTFISSVTRDFVTTGPVTQVDELTRKLTYLPAERLIAATHTNNPRGILLFDRKGNPAGQISTTQFGTPQVITYITSTSEFALVFRDTADSSKKSKLLVLTRQGLLSRVIDFAPAGVTRITGAAYFNPRHPTGGQFLIIDGQTNTAVITDFYGAPLDNFSIREKLGILAPTAVTTIATTRTGSEFAIANGESSEIVVFSL